MDNGEEIPGLNESWSFLGAGPMEWIGGASMSMVIYEMFISKVAYGIAVLLLGAVITAVILAHVKKQFLDAERGIRNYLCTLLGFAPPGIPAPSSIQPVWSGAPMRGLKEGKPFMALNLEEVLNRKDEDDQVNLLPKGLRH